MTLEEAIAQLEKAIAQLEEVMKANKSFDIPDPHKVTILHKMRFDRWSPDEGGKTLECPVCRKSFSLKLEPLVVPESKGRSELRAYFPEFHASVGKGRADSEDWAACSEECATILNLRLDGINDEKKRELAALHASKKLQKAARKLAGLKERKSTTPPKL